MEHMNNQPAESVPRPAATIYGVDQSEFQAAFAAHVEDVAVSRFSLTIENGGALRLAMGRAGAPIDESGGRAPPHYFTAAVMAPAVAFELMQLLSRVLSSIRPPNMPAVPDRPPPTN